LRSSESSVCIYEPDRRGARCFGHITGSLPSADALNYLPMFTLAFEHTHRVLLTRFTGWLSSEDIVQLDRAVVAFVVRAGPVRGLLDFSGIEGITAPPPFFAVRGQSPQIAPRKRRVIVAPHRELYDLARAFAAQQRELGNVEPRVVTSLRDAYRLLRLKKPKFRPVRDL